MALWNVEYKKWVSRKKQREWTAWASVSLSESPNEAFVAPPNKNFRKLMLNESDTAKIITLRMLGKGANEGVVGIGDTHPDTGKAYILVDKRDYPEFFTET